MPLVVLRADLDDGDKGEETLSEYLCDCSGCPNPAEQVIGFARELGGGFAVCADRAAEMKVRRAPND